MPGMSCCAPRRSPPTLPPRGLGPGALPTLGLSAGDRRCQRGRSQVWGRRQTGTSFSSLLRCFHAPQGQGNLCSPRVLQDLGTVPGCPFWPRPGAAGLLRGRLGLSGALEAMKTGTAVGKQRRGWKRGVGSRLHPPVPGGARLPLPGRKGHRRGRAMPDPATLGARCSPGFQPSAGLRECPSRAQLRRPFASAELKAAPASAGA